MNDKQITVPARHCARTLLPLLRGRVFHCAKLEYLPGIQAVGAILPNCDFRLPTSFGQSANGYFRKRGCVSVFDYRKYDGPEFEEHWRKCEPWLCARCGGTKSGKMIVFFLGDSAVARLRMRGSDWSPDQLVVPYVEAGHPGKIPLTEIASILRVEVLPEPEGSWESTIELAGGG